MKKEHQEEILEETDVVEEDLEEETEGEDGVVFQEAEEEGGKMSNKCSLCGKERVVVKTRKEKVGNSYVISREMSCPDPECQKKVEKTLFNEAKKRSFIKGEQLKREQERKKRVANSLKG